MAFTPPPPYDRDFVKARDAGRRERARQVMQKPPVGKGVLAAIKKLLKRS